jgi:hypothetical protein
MPPLARTWSESSQEPAPLCCECWQRVDDDGVILDRPYGVEAYHAACYRSRGTAEEIRSHG